MLKYVRGSYKRQLAHIIVKGNDVWFFQATTGALLHEGKLKDIPHNRLAKMVDCVLYSLLVDISSDRKTLALFTSKGKQKEVVGIGTSEVKNIIERIKPKMLCRLDLLVVDNIVQSVYVVRR